ncbi:helix-turn-helix domain-containing protein [Candidatus Pacearchaeota archaeon]|nr:helix-turn-helix domain-containing protein [Candidatus Pacearchaeota archaeon]
MEELMTIEEIAKYLRYSVHTIYPLAQKGEIPAIKLAGQWRFRKSEVDKWLEKQLNN